jgi:hypothetical protein
MLDPSRTNERSDTELPMSTKSRTLKLDPSLATP